MSFLRALTVSLVVGAIGFFASGVYAATPKWTEWEEANSVAKKGQWLVIRQPYEGFCYMKQGYEDSSVHMDLAMKSDGVPYFTTPFFHGIQGDISYRVDDGPVRIIPDNGTNSSLIKLSPEVVSELKRGSALFVRVKPVGMSALKQSFDLRGFTAANKVLGSSVCQEKAPDRYQY